MRFAKDREGRYLLCNRAASEIIGKPIEQVLGRDDRALFEPEQAAVLMANDAQVMAQDRLSTYEEEVGSGDHPITVLATKGPRMMPKGGWRACSASRDYHRTQAFGARTARERGDGAHADRRHGRRHVRRSGSPFRVRQCGAAAHARLRGRRFHRPALRGRAGAAIPGTVDAAIRATGRRRARAGRSLRGAVPAQGRQRALGGAACEPRAVPRPASGAVG